MHYVFYLILITQVFSKLLLQRPVKILNNNINNNVGIIVFAGYGKKASSYTPLILKIKNNLTNKNITADFIINDYILDSPLCGDIQTEYLTQKSIASLNCNKYFFIGHSAGSYFLNNVARDYGDGFVQMGSVLNSNGILPWEKGSLSEYPIPTLTLLGEKDGFISPFLAIDEIKDILNSNQSFYKPVIIEKKVNHLQMSDNKETIYSKLFNKKDITSPLSIEEAHDKLSETIAEFISACFYETKNNEIISQKMDETNRLLENYNTKCLNLTNIAKEIQLNITDRYNEYTIINRNYKNKQDFIISKPEISNKNIYIGTYKERVNFLNSYYSNTIWFKFKSHENFNRKDFKDIIKPSDINEKMFNTMLIQLKSTHEINNGPEIIFMKDKIFENNPMAGVKFISEHIKINYDKENNKIFIKSPLLLTSMDVFKRYAGMYYMKILSPELCFELINLYF
jgi:hypothetical protein